MARLDADQALAQVPLDGRRLNPMEIVDYQLAGTRDDHRECEQQPHRGPTYEAAVLVIGASLSEG